MSDTAMKTSKSGYLTRKLVDGSHDVIITEEDCGTVKGLKVSALTKHDGTLIEDLASRISNRVANEDIIIDGKVFVAKDELITPKKAEIIDEAGVKTVEIRTVLHCNCKNGVCRKCYGGDLTTNKLVDLHAPVGVVAAQSIGEPATQLNMKSKTTGGGRGLGGNVAEGFARLSQLLGVTVPQEFDLAYISPICGTIVEINDYDETEKQIIIVDANTANRKEIIFSKNKVLLDDIKVGAAVQAGQQLTYGSVNIKELLLVAGIDRCREYIISEAQTVYRSQGIETNDKYLEVIVHQMSNKMKILNPGDSDYFIGKYIDVNTFTEINKKLFAENKTPIAAVPVIFGLDDIPCNNNSFLSAASFQDSKIILTNAAVQCSVDELSYLKENIILGNLIPAGTAFESKEKLLADAQKMYDKEY
jgi:DNA-directed RNA polymerase subunit beta'